MHSSFGGWSNDGTDGPAGAPPQHERYRIEGLLGQGGMGEVYRAWDLRLERYVALKRLRSTGAGAGRVARLLREARVTARLDHPGIVPVLDQGETVDGHVFYTMRLIRGRTLREASEDSTLPQLLAHLLAAAQAVAYAHDRGVVHRDLKPDNIMVGPYGETQVVDWGLARAVDGDDAVEQGVSAPLSPALTQLGEVVGTPRYLSPEAVAGARMGPADDVFALGATLVEVVTGLRADDAAGWSTAAQGLQEPELRALALRALGTEAERYPLGGAFAEDLRAYLEGRRVTAHDYSLWQLLSRQVSRWRWPLSVVGASVVVGAVALSVAGISVLRERDRALGAELRERSARLKADEALAGSLVQLAERAVRASSRGEAEVWASQALAHGELPRAVGVLMALGAVEPPALVEHPVNCDGVVWVGLDGWLCEVGDEVRTARGRVVHRGPLQAAAPSVAGAWIAQELNTLHAPLPALPVPGIGGLDADGDRAARLIRLGLVLQTADGLTREEAPCGEVRSHLAGAWGTEGYWTVCLDGTARMVPLDGPVQGVVLPGVHATLFDIAVRGEVMYLATGDERIELRDLRTGFLSDTLDVGLRTRRIEVSPSGRWLLLEADQGGPVLVDGVHGRSVLRLPQRWRGAVFRRDGHLVVGGDGMMSLDPSGLQPSALVTSAGVSTAALDPSGERVAVALGDGTVEVFNTHTGALVHRLELDPAYVVKGVAWSADGTVLAAAHNGMVTPRRFLVESWLEAAPFEQSAYCRQLLALADGSWPCLAYSQRLPTLLGTGRGSQPHSSTFLQAGQSSPHAAVLLDGDGGLWRLQPGGQLDAVAVRKGAFAVAAGGDGVVVAVAEPGKIVVLRDGEVVHELAVPSGVTSLALSRDDAWLAAGALDGSVRVWQVVDGRLRAVLRDLHEERVSWLAFSDEMLFSGGWDRHLHRSSLSPLHAVLTAEAAEQRWHLQLEALSGE